MPISEINTLVKTKDDDFKTVNLHYFKTRINLLCLKTVTLRDETKNFGKNIY
jgi:hypothetical protein